MAQFLTFLSAIVRRWNYRRRVLLLLACLSLGLSIILSNGGVQASISPSWHAQAQPDLWTDVWTTVADARQSYNNSQYETAKSSWQVAVNDFTVQGDYLNQAMSLSNLSLTHQALGEWPEAETAIEQSLELLDKPALPYQTDSTRVLAQSLDVHGNLKFAVGQPKAALRDWQRSEQLYASINDERKYASSLLNQAQAYQVMGQYLQAERQLKQVKEQLEQTDDLTLKFFVGRSLANSQRLLGELTEADKTLHQLLESQALSAVDLAALYNDLGNIQIEIAQRLGRLNKLDNKKIKINESVNKAWIAYNQAAELSAQSARVVLHLQTQINTLNLLIQFQPQLENTDVLQKRYALEKSLDHHLASDALLVSRDTIYVRINYAESLLRLAKIADNSDELYQKAAQLLGQAVWLTENQLNDQRTRAYAIGRLGTLYIETSQLTEARPFLDSAILIAEHANAPDISYRWQRQLGKLLELQAENAERLNDQLKAEALREESIVAYRAALTTLGKVRSNLLPVDSEVQFSFRDEVEPVYREFIELLVKTTDENTEFGQKRLKEALQSFDSLQLAEINNFLGCDSGQRIQINQVGTPNTATIYAMLLNNRIAIVFSLPGTDKLRVLWEPLESDSGQALDIVNEIDRLKTSLREPGETEVALETARLFYHSLIEPIEQLLAQENDKSIELNSKNLDEEESRLTLVFVLDGELRNIPMAILNDGQQFLIQKYNIVLNPRIDLFKPKPLTDNLQILLGGVSEQPKDGEEYKFEPITLLKPELCGIKAGKIFSEIFSNESSAQRVEELCDIRSEHISSELLIDDDFTQEKIRQRLSNEKFSIVHFKTHGTFSSDPEATFIIGHENDYINGRQLGNLIQSGNVGEIKVIDLLALSACQSAEGDNRAVLGLTGVAVRAGARTVVSSLWNVKDSYNTKFMLYFYRQLTQPNTTRAAAFRAAQLQLISEYAQPYEWAPFILVGNWL